MIRAGRVVVRYAVVSVVLENSGVRRKVRLILAVTSLLRDTNLTQCLCLAHVDRLKLAACLPTIRSSRYPPRAASAHKPSLPLPHVGRAFHENHVRRATDVVTTDRLATQSAADALQIIGSSSTSAISSGIKYLDNSLTGNHPSAGAGFGRGKIAEVWGPAGAGKTAIAFQAAVEAIKVDGKVAWMGEQHQRQTDDSADELQIVQRF